MALGALLDAGADPDAVRDILAGLEVPGWELVVSKTLRGGITATDVRVEVAESGVVRTAAHILGLIAEADLPERVRRRALATFGALATVEARLHDAPWNRCTSTRSAAWMPSSTLSAPVPLWKSWMSARCTLVRSPRARA